MAESFKYDWVAPNHSEMLPNLLEKSRQTITEMSDISIDRYGGKLIFKN